MNKLKSLLVICTMVLSLFATTSIATAADYTITIPHKPVNAWSTALLQEWKKVLKKDVALKYHPGARQIPGVNYWHNNLQNNDDSMLFTHGGNAMAHLLETVDYDLRLYTPVGAQNLAIIVLRKTDVDWDEWYNGNGKVIAAYNPGVEPDLMALTLLWCGDDKTMDQYLKCYKDKFITVRAMKGSDRTLAYKRGELNMLRGNPTNYARKWHSIENSELWFSHGVFNMTTGKIDADPNGYRTFNDVFEARWGHLPSGRYYDAYVLIKNYRDLLQKILWVGPNNPNAKELQDTLRETVKEGTETRANINKTMGVYNWLIGDEVKVAFTKLQAQTTEQALKDVIWWYNEAFGFQTEYKEDMVAK